MALAYKLLADIRIDLPPGEVSVVDREKSDVSLRDCTFEDLQYLVRNAERLACGMPSRCDKESRSGPVSFVVTQF
jgi:hypothetical protein